MSTYREYFEEFNQEVKDAIQSEIEEGNTKFSLDEETTKDILFIRILADVSHEEMPDCQIALRTFISPNNSKRKKFWLKVDKNIKDYIINK